MGFQTTHLRRQMKSGEEALRQRKPQKAQEITHEDPKDTDRNGMPSALGPAAGHIQHCQTCSYTEAAPDL